jgi:hypothetical protein
VAVDRSPYPTVAGSSVRPSRWQCPADRTQARLALRPRVSDRMARLDRVITYVVRDNGNVTSNVPARINQSRANYGSLTVMRLPSLSPSAS